MKPITFIVEGRRKSLQKAYRNLIRFGGHKTTIYPFRRRYRMMITGGFTEQEVSGIMNDSELKISTCETN